MASLCRHQLARQQVQHQIGIDRQAAYPPGKTCPTIIPAAMLAVKIVLFPGAGSLERFCLCKQRRRIVFAAGTHRRRPAPGSPRHSSGHRQTAGCGPSPLPRSASGWRSSRHSTNRTLPISMLRRKRSGYCSMVIPECICRHRSAVACTFARPRSASMYPCGARLAASTVSGSTNCMWGTPMAASCNATCRPRWHRRRPRSLGRRSVSPAGGYPADGCHDLRCCFMR